MLALPINETSAKIRSAPRVDDEDDSALPCRSGVLPLRLTALAPQPDPRLPAALAGRPRSSGLARH